MIQLKLFDRLLRRIASGTFYHKYAYTYYHNREDYYRSLLKDDNLQSLSNLLKEGQHIPLNTEIEINFRNLAFGTDISHTIRRLGQARFIIDNNAAVEGHKILFYRFKIDTFNTIAQLHFLNNHFFSATYTFKHLHTLEMRKIINILKSKYFVRPVAEDKIFQVRDLQNNVIALEKSLYLNIKYISGMELFPEHLNKLFIRHLELESKREFSSSKSLANSL